MPFISVQYLHKPISFNELSSLKVLKGEGHNIHAMQQLQHTHMLLARPLLCSACYHSTTAPRKGLQWCFLGLALQPPARRPLSRSLQSVVGS